MSTCSSVIDLLESFIVVIRIYAMFYKNGNLRVACDSGKWRTHHETAALGFAQKSADSIVLLVAQNFHHLIIQLNYFHFPLALLL